MDYRHLYCYTDIAQCNAVRLITGHCFWQPCFTVTTSIYLPSSINEVRKSQICYFFLTAILLFIVSCSVVVPCSIKH